MEGLEGREGREKSELRESFMSMSTYLFMFVYGDALQASPRTCALQLHLTLSFSASLRSSFLRLLWVPGSPDFNRRFLSKGRRALVAFCLLPLLCPTRHGIASHCDCGCVGLSILSCHIPSHPIFLETCPSDDLKIPLYVRALLFSPLFKNEHRVLYFKIQAYFSSDGFLNISDELLAVCLFFFSRILRRRDHFLFFLSHVDVRWRKEIFELHLSISGLISIAFGEIREGRRIAIFTRSYGMRVKQAFFLHHSSASQHCV